MAGYYDRYKLLKLKGVNIMPNVTIDKRSTDFYVEYRQGSTRFDTLSNEYYNSPYYDFLILLANRQYGLTQFDIPDNTIIRIPFPLDEALSEYENKLRDILNL